MVLSVQQTTEFFTGVSEGPIHMDRVACSGQEPLLVNCSYATHHDCTHAKDIGVVCPGKMCAMDSNRLHKNMHGVPPLRESGSARLEYIYNYG